MGTFRALSLKAAVVTALVLGADQAAKLFVRQHLALCAQPPLSQCARLRLGGAWGLVRTENAGSAFGYLPGWWVWVLVAALGGLLISVYARRLRQPGWDAAVGVGLQTGGALGNLVDRLVYGRVTDFVDLGRGPIFNLGDVALAVGMGWAIGLLLQARRAARAAQPPSGL